MGLKLKESRNLMLHFGTMRHINYEPFIQITHNRETVVSIKILTDNVCVFIFLKKKYQPSANVISCVWAIKNTLTCATIGANTVSIYFSCFALIANLLNNTKIWSIFRSTQDCLQLTHALFLDDFWCPLLHSRT